MYPDLFPRKLFESTIKKNSEFLIGPHEKNGLLPMGILIKFPKSHTEICQPNLLSFKLLRVIPFDLFSFGKYYDSYRFVLFRCFSFRFVQI